MATQVPAVQAAQLPSSNRLATQAIGRLRSKLWWIVGIVGAAALVGYFAPSYLFGPIVPVSAVTRQDIVQTVVASGQVQTPFRISVSSQITGSVVDVPAAEGQQVKAGELLIQLSYDEAQAAVGLAEGSAAQARAKLNQLTGVAARSAAETLRQARATALNSRKTYERAATLRNKGFGTMPVLDQARQALDVAESQVSAAEVQAATNKPGGADYLVAETQLAQAEASLQSARVRQTYTAIRAPRDGLLIAVSVQKGDVVQPGKTLMSLSPAGETQLLVRIDEQNLSLLHIGEPATVSADAFPKQTFPAVVTYITPAIDPVRGSVDVKLTVANPPDYLRQDMTVSIEIEVARHTNAIVVANTTLHDLRSAKPWVSVVADGKAQHRDVTIGAVGDTTVEILTGLTVGDQVVAGPAVLTDGQRVRMSGG